VEFEWDEGKAASNLAKHGVTFDEASHAFEDVFAISVTDPCHSQQEIREITIGMVEAQHLVTVATPTETKCVVL